MPKTKTRGDGGKSVGAGLSEPTSLFLPCPGNHIAEAHLTQFATAIRVMEGPKSWWHECGICNARVIYPKRRYATIRGLTMQEAQAQGYVALV